MLDPTYPLIPVASFLSFVIVLIPLPWHLQAWNVGTCAYMIWTGLSALNQFINSVVWANDAINRAPVWCDISTRLVIAANVAVPCASLTITRRLYKISRVQSVVSSPKERRRELAIDLSICVGFPIFQMILYYFVQGHRFNIFEQVGCFPATFNTPPAYPLIWMWPLVLGCISMVYGVLTITSFLKRRKEMSQFLNSNSQITFSRYFRLMMLAMVDTAITVPFSIFVIWLNAFESEVSPWKGLADAHWGFSRVEQFAAVEWRLSHWNTVSFYIDRWAIIFCACLFFGFFGFAEESRKNYAKAYWFVMRRFGYRPQPKGFVISGASDIRTPNLPVMSNPRDLKILITQDSNYEKRGSFISSIGDLSSSFSVESRYDDAKDGKSPVSTTSSDSLPPSPDDIELVGIPHLHALSPSSHIEVSSPQRPPRPTSLDPHSLDMV